MLIGDRSGFDDATYQTFIDSGLVHIVAVSGGNLVMIMVFLGLILIRVPLRIRTVIMAGAIISYALIVGMDSSIFRAVIMALLTMGALLSGRIANIRRLMAIAALLMLWRNPYFLRQDIGFIFSFAALIGIILIRPRIAKSTTQTRRLVWRQRLPHLVWADYILPTLGASLAVMPFLLLFTDSRNILSLLANLLVLPIVPLVMIG
ncbi:MAG: ComEC/Rec2 family competence protein [Candidatus Peribacteria bacterium]|nr:MAG: ComEC/Rec2 family competence protein [Candidatus Peribacteria bacterium]